MIYSNKHFKKELSSLYVNNKLNTTRLFLKGLFLAMISFAFHFVFQTMYESVLTEWLPEIMLPSFFSSIYLFTFVSFIYFIIDFSIHYSDFTFAEIKDNTWYVLTRMGYQVNELIWNKLGARFITSFVVYTVGFIFNLLATSLLSYAFVPDYFFPLFLMGLIDILMVISITLTYSLFIYGKRQAILVIVLSSIAIFVVKIVSGFYSIVSNRALMQNIANMFDFGESIYIPICIVTFLVCILLCLIRANRIAKFCSVTPLSHEEEYYYIDRSTPTTKHGEKSGIVLSKIAKVVNIFLVIIVSVSVLFNGFILVFSALQKDDDNAIGGVVILVFQSTTMEPYIIKNDLVFLKKRDVQYPLSKGMIVAYHYDNQVEISMIQSIDGDNITVDVTNYPALAEKDAMKRKITRADVFAEHTYTNRFLGAIILFANTLFGRITMLLVPTILIFYEKQIVNIINKVSKKRHHDKMEQEQEP